MSGKLHLLPSWAVNCANCGRDADIADDRTRAGAIKTLRGDGWRTRRGLWHCASCLTVDGKDWS